jgi:GH15 family glucan-1,4-alpha-glucosidase
LTQDNTFIQDYWWAIGTLVRWVGENWTLEDASLWEFRDDDDAYTHSRLMGWVTMKIGARLARTVMKLDTLAEHWEQVATDIANALWQDLHHSGLPYFTQGPRHRQVDAALLTLPLYGFVAADHPAFLATLEQIEAELNHHGLIYRYRADNMGPAHHPFTLAGFWLARVYLRLGQPERADELIAAQLSCTTSLGLFSEHVDQDTLEPRGNFPQLFPHAGLVTTLKERQMLDERLLNPFASD